LGDKKHTDLAIRWMFKFVIRAEVHH